MTVLLAAEGLSLPGRLFDVGLRLEAGTLACLVGPNGSGKTSLLHALAGIGGPGGEVAVDGVDPRRLGPARRPRYLTFLPASRELAWPLRADALVSLGGATREEAGQAMAELELAPVAHRRVDLLSTGERSRVLLARALAPRPKLLLLDEPTANLDPLWQIRLMELVRAEIAGGGRAALVAIHDLDAAARYAHRILVMDKGRVVADGVPSAVLAGDVIPQIFGVAHADGQWHAAPRAETSG